MSEDGTNRSFLIEREDGVEILRNARYLKHEWKNPRNKIKQVSWQDADRAPADGAPADRSPTPAL